MNRSKYAKLIGLAAGFLAASVASAHSDAFKPGFVDTMVKPYLQIQEQLAGDNLDGAKASASDFMKAMKDAPEGAPAEEVEDFTGPALKIANAADMQSAREAFEKLSTEMITLVDHNGTSGKTPLYMVHCPMAFGNTGASWLQDDKTIANPYHGSMMLRCGSVQKQLAGK